jgi:hypothetical protein
VGQAGPGIQLFGSARAVGGENDNQAETLYTKRFPDFTETDLSANGFCVFRPRRLKLFDERALWCRHVRDRAPHSRPAARMGADRDLPFRHLTHESK